MEVRWSSQAAEDLERICEWIHRDRPEAARRVAQTIYDGCERLRNFPSNVQSGLSTVIEEYSAAAILWLH